MKESVTQLSRYRGTLLILAAALGGYLWFLHAHPLTQTWGDEQMYTVKAHFHDFDDGQWSGSPLQPLTRFLPGHMEYGMWPPFASVVYSLLGVGDIARDYTPQQITPNRGIDPRLAPFFERLFYFNAGLLLLCGLLVFLISRQLGLSIGFANLAMLVVLFNPRLIFYVQALWPELLHLALVLAAFALLLPNVNRRSMFPPIIAGLLLGYASLTKGVVFNYAIILSVVGGIALLLFRKKLNSQRTAAYFIALVTLFTINGLQRYANLQEHGVTSISDNFWLNIEIGMESALGDQFDDVWGRYRQHPGTLREKEAASRERVLSRLESVGTTQLVLAYARQYLSKQITSPFLEGGIGYQRWKASQALKPLVPLANILSMSLLLLGMAGILTAVLNNPGHFPFILYPVYYLAASVLVSANPRMFVQAIPFLAIFSALFLSWLMMVYRSRRNESQQRPRVAVGAD